MSADLVVPSRTRPDVRYPMVVTPDGVAVHQGEGCDGELFNGPTACWHSRDFSRSETMTQALVKADSVLTPSPVEFNDEQLSVIKNTIAKGATNDELALFVSTCKRTGLDPFMRQIYAVKRWDSKEKKEVMAIQVGVDGMRLIAERSGKYGGQDPIEWLDEDGVWSEVWTGKGDFPFAARCSVYRKDWNGRKVTAVCRWSSYAQYFGNPPKLSPTWDKMPDVMLGKCAEVLALRRAFPAEMSALAASIDMAYDPALDAEELDQASPEAFEGEYREVPAVPEPEPITDATRIDVTEAWKALAGAYQQAERMADLVQLRSEWAQKYPDVFLEKTNRFLGATEPEGQELLRLFKGAMPGCEHEARWDDARAVQVCGKCGVILEGPEAEGEPAQPSLMT